ncbi:hypothetical protein OHA61_17515 [Streptomyces sp. NBC_00885]|uniref:hypothetical protein n=1 Tax=Streptomyces sp. NBC_00885 TaxID=2975857 RepID=UPI00386731BA|nr:hypothetical protein OHA61_17515 [Streptomyces sp. NBC_00885]
MDIPWAEIASTSAAALSAVAAVGAWKAATRSNSTAERVEAIERDRWHADLLPQFDIRIERIEGDRATLDVQLTGPLPLCSLDNVEISIASSDDQERVNRLPQSRPTQDDIDTQVWGPWRFTHGADGADVGGNTVAPMSLQVGRGRPFAIERTRPPFWMEGPELDETWRERWREKPLRLHLRCTRGDDKPWSIPYAVDEARLPQ